MLVAQQDGKDLPEGNVVRLGAARELPPVEAPPSPLTDEKEGRYASYRVQIMPRTGSRHLTLYEVSDGRCTYLMARGGNGLALLERDCE